MAGSGLGARLFREEAMRRISGKELLQIWRCDHCQYWRREEEHTDLGGCERGGGYRLDSGRCMNWEGEDGRIWGELKSSDRAKGDS